MKYTIFSILLVFSLITLFSFQTSNDDMKIAGNTLLEKVLSLDQSSCYDLPLIRNYMVAYQQLQKKHHAFLKDYSQALKEVDNKIRINSCDLSSWDTPYGYSFVKTVTITGGDGSGEIEGKTIPAHLFATLYMNTEAKEAYLSYLPEELRLQYFQISEKWKTEDSSISNILYSEINEIKAIDNKNYVNWYFQNYNESLLQNIAPNNLEELKLDLKQKTLEYKH